MLCPSARCNGMDIVEDLLFGAQDSPEPIDDPWQDDFDDEQMLDIAENGYETDFDLFDTQHEVSTYSCRMPNSPRLASACAPIDSSDDLLLESSGNWSIGDAAVAVDASKGPPCDRYLVELRTMVQDALTPEQTLGHRPS